MENIFILLESKKLNLIKKRENNLQNFTKNKEKLLALKSIFSSNNKKIISDLTSLFEKIETLEKKKIEEKSQESPASASRFKNILFPNGSHIYTSEGTAIGHRTVSSPNPLPNEFRVNIRMNKITEGGYQVFGVSRVILDEKKGYLGGDMGVGNWGIAGNGSLGEEGKWGSGTGFKQGDIVTLTGNNGIISYNINNTPNTYTYNMLTSQLYLTLTYYYLGEIYEIIP